MSASRDQQNLEYRWVAATAAAFACVAVGLVTATIMLTTGNRLEFRPPPSEISRLDDELVRTFDVLNAMAARQAAGAAQTTGTNAAAAGSEISRPPAAETSGTPRKRRIVMRLKSPWCTGALRGQSFYRCRTRSW